jgi:hypothetical protein
MPATLARRRKGVTMSEKPRSNHSQAGKAQAQLRALRRRVTMEPVDSTRWRIMLDGKQTDLIITSSIHDGWAVSKASGEILARNCRSSAEAADVAAHYLFDPPAAPGPSAL